MPTNRRKRLPRRRSNLDELDFDARYHLENGMPFLPESGFPNDLVAFTEAWRRHGEALLEEFLDKHPRRRPFAWWFLEHGQERPIVGTFMTPDGIERLREENRPYAFGFLHTAILGDCKPDRSWTPLQEPEAEYLERLDLLTDDELS